MTELQTVLESHFRRGALRNIALRVGRHDEVLFEHIESRTEPLTADSLFDMASTTKIIVTASLILLAFDRGLLSPDTPITDFFAAPAPYDKLTVRHFLCHTTGIGRRVLSLPQVNYLNVADHIFSLPPEVEPGSDMRYSCPGYILLGKIAEEIFGDRLDRIFRALVAAPLGMDSTLFRPDGSRHTVNACVTETERGLVNDYNCRHFGGIAGNAGVFSTLNDMTRYAAMLAAHGEPLIGRRVFDEAIRLHTAGMSTPWGLGFRYVDESFAQTGELFPTGSFGHCGHTGQSVFAAPGSGLWAVLLTDATLCSYRHGHEFYPDTQRLRAEVHTALKHDLKL
ncbi:MAG: beta-lactamase family protein [Clostridia bacterium]|nr:beta-lactamase family protein [Clostridia bacterium]